MYVAPQAQISRARDAVPLATTSEARSGRLIAGHVRIPGVDFRASGAGTGGDLAAMIATRGQGDL